MDKWIVHTKGGPNRASFEVAVVLENNRHGQASYGWFGPDKLLISHNGGACDWPVTNAVWNRLLRIAEETAKELNR